MASFFAAWLNLLCASAIFSVPVLKKESNQKKNHPCPKASAMGRAGSVIRGRKGPCGPNRIGEMSK
jgi:hypothetical protein